MANQHDNSAVLVTGASSGIGYATALLLDKRGYRVFAGVRQDRDADRLRQEASDRLCPVILDITKPDQIAEAVKLVESRLGKEGGLKGLVNNAGICVMGPLEFLPVDRLRRQIEVNLIGHVAVTQAFLPMIRSVQGRIINISSACGKAALPFFGAYVASKFAMEGMTDTLRIELRPWRIRVILIEPGTVEAPIWDRTTDTEAKLFEGATEHELRLYGKPIRALVDLMRKGREAAIGAEKLAEVVVKALEARRPRARYQRGPGAGLAVIGSRLPAAVTDWVLDRVLAKKLPSSMIGW